MADQDTGPGNFSIGQQGMQFGADLTSVARLRAGLAPAHPRPVLRTHAPLLRGFRLDPGPIGGDHIRRHEDHRRAALSNAIDMKAVTTDIHVNILLSNR